MPDHVYEFFLNVFQDTLELRETEKEDRNDFVSILIRLRNEEKTKNDQIGKFVIKQYFKLLINKKLFYYFNIPQYYNFQNYLLMIY